MAAANPYAPPTTASPPSAIKHAGPGWDWKVYCVSMCAMWPVSIGLDAVSCYQLADVVTTLIGLVSTLGLFGYAFSYRMLSQAVWRPVLPLAVLSDLVYWFVLWPRGWAGVVPGEDGQANDSVVLTIVVLLVLGTPTYVALYRYAYRRGRPWTTGDAPMTST